MDAHENQHDFALAALVKRVGTLFGRGHGTGRRLEWREIETLLTDGYALALTLESERARLRSLGADIAVIERDIRWLRSLMDQLHVNGRRFRSRLAPGFASGRGGIRPLDEKTRRKATV